MVSVELSAPIHVLKSNAKALKCAQSITMVEALDQIAQAEGLPSWSLLQAKAKAYMPQTSEEVLAYLYPGDMLLIGARPGLGKTTLTLQVLLQAIGEGRRCFFFSLEYTHKVLADKLASLDPTYETHKALLTFDFSDDISSDYIIRETEDSIVEGAIIGVDYLQLLDQQRHKPPLQQQIEALKAYAQEKRCIFMFISQIDRVFEQSTRRQPGLDDVRLPNPLDLGLFNKSIFLQEE
jgi:replicative DNA helicase